jgi:hypothetical protein
MNAGPDRPSGGPEEEADGGGDVVRLTIVDKTVDAARVVAIARIVIIRTVFTQHRWITAIELRWTVRMAAAMPAST